MNPNENVEKLRARIEEYTAAESEKTAKEMAARGDYKIQLWFQSERSGHKPVAYTLSVWESGKRLHGGGDECMFICKRHRDAPKPFDVVGVKNPLGCGNFISGDLVGLDGQVVCPHCFARHKVTEIGDSAFFRTSMDRAASILEEWWMKLQGNADLYVKYAPYDIRVKMMRDAYGMQKARELKGMTIYPLANIIKDTSNGASVQARFKALLLA